VRGQLLGIAREGPFEVVARAETPESVAELFYDARADRLYTFPDEGFELIPFVASTMTREASIPVPFAPPGAIRYDALRGEGILCAAGGPITTLEGERFLSVATRGDPLALRPLGTSSLALVSITWGCDFDPGARRAYVAIPNLGLLATVDYDSGELLRTDFVGFGMRSVTHDARRARVYLTSFLGGFVSAVDPASGTEIDRWEVGRFPRTGTLTRDGASLLVGTNVGVVAVPLDRASRPAMRQPGGTARAAAGTRAVDYAPPRDRP